MSPNIYAKRSYLKRAERVCPHCGMGILEDKVEKPVWMKIVFFWLLLERFTCNQCNEKEFLLFRK